MHKHVLWAALIGGCVIASALSLVACTQVESCKFGTIGCLDGPPDESGTCSFDLVAVNGKCLEQTSNEGGTPRDSGTGGDAGDDAGPSVCGTCEPPALCIVERKKCVNLCEAPEELPGSGTAYQQIPCGGETNRATGEPYKLDFPKTCFNTCLLNCRWQNWFCDARLKCDDECKDNNNVLAECVKACNGQTDLLACQREQCVKVRARTCEQTSSLCPEGKVTPTCSDFSCTNQCKDDASAKANAIDGYCDDGAYSYSDTNFCPFGTDCADCGPRPPKPRALDTEPVLFGEPCPNLWRCPNHFDKYQFNDSWCLRATGVGRCYVDCSGDAETCSAGFACTGLDNSKGEPLTDAEGRRGKACVPSDQNLCK